MIGIPGVGSPLSVLNLSKFIRQKIDNFVSERDTNGDNTLSIRESGVPEDILDRVDTNSDGQAGRFEHVIAAHTRAHAVNERINHLISKKDTNGDRVLNVEELATMYHFPVEYAKGPAIERTKAKRGEAPHNVPLSSDDLPVA